jgi:ubiquinol-cytochrome c reductase iron-sulfur subunit
MAKPPVNSQPATAVEDDAPLGDVNAERRALLINTTTAFGVAGAACVAVPFLRTLSPSRATEALATVDINLAEIPAGSVKTYLWQGKPVFVWHRTPEQIAKAKQQDTTSTMDAEPDAERVKKPEWLVVLGVCSHLGCVLMQGGESDGWRCPCHGSQFDLSGRVTHGPAGKNLEVPPYAFLNDTTIRIG